MWCSEILEGSSELRIMLCKEKRSPTSSRIGSSVVAACGALQRYLNFGWYPM